MAASPRSVAWARRVAYWLDDRYLDPLLGFFIPEVGDWVSSAFGLSVVLIAVREKVGLPVIARMLTNLAIDAAVGAVPLLGDVFDFVFKANNKNLALLEARTENRRGTAKDWAIVVGSIAVLVAAFAVSVVVVVLFTKWVVHVLSS